MARISLYRSSSLQLAIFFSALIGIALYLFAKEIHMIGPGSDASSISLRLLVMVLLLIAGGMFYVSYEATRRINRILRTADTIMRTGDLSARIPVDNRWDDLSTLSRFINRMLAEIEESMQAISHVSDNIAHDLRTPLTRLRNRLEALKHKPCGGQDYAEHMQSIINECDSILGTFQALLRISRIENQRQTTHFTSINLTNLLDDVVELYEPLAQEKQQEITLQSENIQITAERDLLFQCITNLLDNAIKYTPQKGNITVTLQQKDQHAILEISDTGRGITDAQKEKVFQRFYRGDAMRCTPGNGLGLSLVAAIIKLHGGTITLHDHAPSGLTVRVRLPL